MRTTAELVEAIIELDDSNEDLTPFMEIASSLVDRVATADTESELTEANLQQIETWLSAHFYTNKAPRRTQERVGTVSETFQSAVDLGLYTSHYGQTAMTLDVTGYLRSLAKGRLRASVTYVGGDAEEEIQDD